MERRNTVRMRVLKGSKLTFDRLGTTIDCTVRNLSNSGACLELGTVIYVPKEFDLSFDSFRSIRHCRIKWRTGKRLGVAFIA